MASASSPASGGGGGGGTPAPQPAVPTLDVDIESASFDPLLGTVVYAVGVRSSCRSGAAGGDGGVAEQEEQGAASGGAMRVLQKRFSDFNALYTHVSGGPSLMIPRPRRALGSVCLIGMPRLFPLLRHHFADIPPPPRAPATATPTPSSCSSVPSTLSSPASRPWPFPRSG
eukprot:SAG25_NODE_129_length_14495_cov_41.326202_3_plen_171_part_00